MPFVLVLFNQSKTRQHRQYYQKEIKGCSGPSLYPPIIIIGYPSRVILEFRLVVEITPTTPQMEFI